MTFAKFVKDFKEDMELKRIVYKEGEEAYYKMLCNYSYQINPYKDCTSAWSAYHWQCGFQHAYYEQNREKLAKYSTEPEPNYNFRNEGESTGIDRYFGRGL